MPVKNLYVCDLCGSPSEENTEEYRLDGLNYTNCGFSIFPATGGNPMHMPGIASQSTSKSETHLVCSKCLPKFQADLLALFAQFAPLV